MTESKCHSGLKWWVVSKLKDLALDMYNFYHRQGLGLSWARNIDPEMELERIRLETREAVLVEDCLSWFAQPRRGAAWKCSCPLAQLPHVAFAPAVGPPQAAALARQPASGPRKHRAA